MAACNRGELDQKWAAERSALRHECYVELKHKLLEVAQAQLLVRSEGRKTLHDALEGETLLDLKKKLDAIALSGKRLSQVFMNSLVETSVQRIAAAGIQSKEKNKQGVPTDEPRSARDNNADFHPWPRCSLATSSATVPGITPRTSDCFQDTTSPYSALSHMDAAVEGDYSLRGACIGGAAGLTLEGCLAAHVFKQPRQDDAYGHSSQTCTQLAKLVQQRLDLGRQVSEERNLFANRSAFLRECRVAAEKEKEMAQKELAAAMCSLAIAEKERAVAAKCRASALDDLKRMTSREATKPQGICGVSLGLQGSESPETPTGYKAPTAWAESLQLHLGNAPRLSLPPPVCPFIPTLTPPYSPDDVEPNAHSRDSCPTLSATYSDKLLHPEIVTELHEIDERPNFDVKEGPVTIPGVLENPIGPYIRPPMPLEDMLKCIRCLFGKDKSLKTGNRARAFLGLPWSEIVSFDPDVLLRRGVLGIKEGSTGMASRLRMMTIIESALSNQNDDTIPAEVWERPTHFCDNCQKRYPISVNSNEAVPPHEESVQRGIYVSSQVSAEGKPRAQEINGTGSSKSKRNKKKLRGTRQTTHPPR